MAMSPDQIAAAVSFLAQKNSSRLSQVQANAMLPKALSPSQRAKRDSAAGRTTSGSGWRGQGGSGYEKAVEKANKLNIQRNAQKNKQERDPDSDLEKVVRGVGRALPFVGLFLRDQDKQGKTDAIDDAFVPQDDTEKPQNLTQSILNGLSTGLYMSARAAEGVGAASAKAQKNITKAAGKGDVAGVAGGYASGIGEGFVNLAGGAARGFSEGLGNRYDNERPRTMGQNLEAVGGIDAVRDTVKNLGGDQGSQDWWAGTTGFVADIAGDPLTYASGAGVVKGLRSAASATGDSLRATGKVTGVSANVQKGGTAAEAGVRAGYRGAQAYRDQLRNAKALKAEGRAYRKANAGSTVDDMSRSQQAAPAATPEAAELPGINTETMIPGNSIIPGTDDVARSADPSAITGKQIDNAVARIDELMAGGTVGTKVAREVPAEQILTDATVTTGGKAGQPSMSQWLATKAEAAPDEPLVFLPGAKRDANGQPIALTPEQTLAYLDDPKTSFEDATFIADQLSMMHQADMARIPTKPQRTGVSPQSMGAAIDSNMPDVAGTYDIQNVLRELSKAKPEMRKKVLQTLFQGDNITPFKDFDTAMKAAVDGQVEMSVMRDMLKALGIRTKSFEPANVQKVLSGKGVMRWSEIKDSMPTPHEVITAHGVDEVTVEAAKAVDVPAVEAAAAADFEEGVAALGGITPPVPGSTSSLEKSMLDNILAAVDGQLDPTNPAYIESYTASTWLSTWRAAFTKDMKGAVNSARKAGDTGLRGAERGQFIYEKITSALRLGETHARATGRQPRLHLEGFDEPFFVSFSQILDEIPAELGMRAFFDLDYRLTTFGQGTDAAAKELFKQGVSVYPTTVARGAHAAMRGEPVDKIFEAMYVKPNLFEKSPKGQETLTHLAQAMDDAHFRLAIRETHDAQITLAVAKAQRVADDVVNEHAGKILTAVVDGGDRSDILGAVNRANAATAKISNGGDPSLVKDMAEQRLTTGILGTLGPEGTAIARHDARMVTITDSKALAAQQAANTARKGKRDAFGRRIASDAPTGVSGSEKALRASTAQNLGKLAEDLGPTIDEGMSVALRTGAYEDVASEAIKAYNDQMLSLGNASIFMKVARAMEGTAGQADIKVLQVMQSSSSFVHSHAYVKDMQMWVHGGTSGLLRKKSGPGVVQRLEAVTGGKVSNDVMNTYIGKWWGSLAAHSSHLEGRFGRSANMDELREALQAGVSRNPRANIAQAVDGIDGDELEMALELYGYINEVFAPTRGPLARSGVATSDLLREMQHYGFGKGGSLSEYAPDANLTLGDQASIWRTYDTGIMVTPLDVLANWHKALSAASVKPSIGAALSKQFDSRALAPNMTPKELAAAGWRRVDTGNSSGVGAYLDPESWFPPEIAKQIPYMNKFFEDMERNMPAVLAHIVGPYDAITGVLKSSMTIWNPSHHVTNILGENFMNLMAGVNPLQQFRAVHAMRAGGKLVDADMAPLDLYRSTFAEAADGTFTGTGTIKDRWKSGDARILIRGADGKLTHADLSAAEIYQAALNNGAAITARESKDLLPGVGKTTTTGWWHKFNQHNPVAIVDNKLGEFSAVRDNVTRLAHFYSTLEKGEYSSVDAAMTAAAKDVHSYHPTIQTLSSFDQQVSRRVIYFHTWVRQAAGRILETAMERPAAVTIPSKYQYNQAEAAGMEPESFGKPNNGDPRMADYYKNGILGPTFYGGFGPFDAPGDMPIDPETGEVEAAHMWGYSMSTPQLDALSTFFGGTSWDDKTPGPLMGTVDNFLDMANPLLKVPGELATNSKVGGIGKPPREDPNYLLSQTGAPYRIQGMLGGRAKTKEADALQGQIDTQQAGFDGDPTDAQQASLEKKQQQLAQIQAQNDSEQGRQILNYVSGLKYTDYTNMTSAKVADFEQTDFEVNLLTEYGYNPEEIKAIRKVWKEKRASQ